MRLQTTVLTLALFTALSLSGQEIESVAGVRFTFATPGARSLGMGGTSVAATDAASAAANPATIDGSGRAASVELRRNEIEGRYYANTSLDTVGQSSTTSGISSAFVTVPFNRGALAFAYDEPLNVDHSTVPLFNGDPAQEATLPATLPANATLSLRRYSTSAAWSVGPLALGASARYERFRQNSSFVASSSSFFPFESVTEQTDAGDWTWSGGAVWKIAERARIGVSYSSGGRFDGTRSFPVAAPQSIEFRTPSSARAGIEFAATPSFTIAAEAVHVAYSEMLQSNRHTFPQGSEYAMADVTEPHAGIEWRHGNLALRAGWWRDPAHALQITNGVVPPTPLNYVTGIVNQSENHVTAGIGYGDTTRFEAAVDRGTYSTRISAGIVSRF